MSARRWWAAAPGLTLAALAAVILLGRRQAVRLAAFAAAAGTGLALTSVGLFFVPAAGCLLVGVVVGDPPRPPTAADPAPGSRLPRTVAPVPS